MAGKCAPVAVFFSTSVALQVASGAYNLPAALLVQVLLAAVGYATGYVILALGSGVDVAQAASPVKWRQKRGFD